MVKNWLRVARSCWTGKTGIEGNSYATLVKLPWCEVLATFPPDGKSLPRRWGFTRDGYPNGSDVTVRLGTRLRLRISNRASSTGRVAT